MRASNTQPGTGLVAALGMAVRVVTRSNLLGVLRPGRTSATTQSPGSRIPAPSGLPPQEECPCWRSLPGHSGATAPDYHRLPGTRRRGAGRGAVAPGAVTRDVVNPAGAASTSPRGWPARPGRRPRVDAGP